MINQILHIGRRGGRTFQQAIDIATYINNNKLTECNIKFLEVPNDYKSAWEELKQEKLVKNYLLEYMQELEQKYNLGINKDEVVHIVLRDSQQVLHENIKDEAISDMLVKFSERETEKLAKRMYEIIKEERNEN